MMNFHSYEGHRKHRFWIDSICAVGATLTKIWHCSVFQHQRRVEYREFLLSKHSAIYFKLSYPPSYHIPGSWLEKRATPIFRERSAPEESRAQLAEGANKKNKFQTVKLSHQENFPENCFSRKVFQTFFLVGKLTRSQAQPDENRRHAPFDPAVRYVRWALCSDSGNSQFVFPCKFRRYQLIRLTIAF